MARSFIHEPKTAPMAPQSWSIGSSGKSWPVFSLMARLERGDELLQVVDGELGVELDAALAFFFASMITSNGSCSFLLDRLEAEDHVAVHRDEAAVAVPGEALVARGRPRAPRPSRR